MWRSNSIPLPMILSLVVHIGIAVTMVWSPKMRLEGVAKAKSVTIRINPAPKREVQAAIPAEAKPERKVAEKVKPKATPKLKPKVKAFPAIPTSVSIPKKAVIEPRDPDPIIELASVVQSSDVAELVSGTELDAKGDDEDAEASGGDAMLDQRTPMLLQATLQKPRYTEEALFAGLEGIFTIDVQVDSDGKVIVAKLLKKVGFGMDGPIVNAILNARFQPGKDSKGRPLTTWTKIKFKLQIPN